jgi:ABC-type oligopeptide transport system ATPase subunit
MGMTERPIVLQGTGVRKYFPVHTGFGKPKKYVKAVDGVDITIHEGEIYGLVGETGCGKSTLGRTLIRLTGPTDGNISVLGKDITKLNDKQMTDMRQKIQMVFQDPYTSLDPKQKVGDILMETLEIHGIGNKKERLDIAMEIMGKVGLRPEHFYRYPHEFSGGQRQRVGLARALILNPKVIVCDEPVSALDVSIQAQIINLLQDLREKDNISFLFIAHDMSVVKYISDRIGVMYLGHLMEEAETEELFANPLHIIHGQTHLFPWCRFQTSGLRCIPGDGS